MEEKKKKEEFIAYYKKKRKELITRLHKAKTIEECEEIDKEHSELRWKMREKYPEMEKKRINDFRMFMQLIGDRIEHLGGPEAPHFSYCDPVE